MDQLSQTKRQTDGQTDRHRQQQYHFSLIGPRGKNWLGNVWELICWECLSAGLKARSSSPQWVSCKTANISSWVNSQPLAPPPPTPDTSIHIKVWDAITYPFSNFSGCAVEIWKRIYNKQFSQMPVPLAAFWKTAEDQDSPPKVLHDVLHTHTVTFWHISNIPPRIP